MGARATVATADQLRTLSSVPPAALRSNAAGNLFIADPCNECVREVNAVTGIITTVAGIGQSPGYSGNGGPATDAQLYCPYGIAVNAAGDLFISDSINECVREVSRATGVITTIAGNGTGGFAGNGGQATAAELDSPRGLALDAAGNLFISDAWNNCVRVVNLSTGTINTVAGGGSSDGSGNGGRATDASLWSPAGVAVDAAGNLLIADSNDSLIRMVSATPPQITVNPPSPTVTVSDAGGTYNGSAFPATATVAGAGGAAATSLEGVTPTLTYYLGAQASGARFGRCPHRRGNLYCRGLLCRQ